MTRSTVSVSLPPDLTTMLEKVCSELDRGKSWVVQKALRRYLTEYLEDLEDLRDAELILADPNLETTPYEEIREELGLK